jgi:hypothetical protein
MTDSKTKIFIQDKIFYQKLRQRAEAVLADLAYMQNYNKDVCYSAELFDIVNNAHCKLYKAINLADDLFSVETSKLTDSDISHTIPNIYCDVDAARLEAMDLIFKIDPKLALNQYNAEAILTELKVLQKRYKKLPNYADLTSDFSKYYVEFAMSFLNISVAETKKLLGDSHKFTEKWQSEMMFTINNFSTFARERGGKNDLRTEYLARTEELAACDQNDNNYSYI